MSNPFTEIKDGQFARKLFASAGLDLTAMRAAGNADALKDHLATLAAAKPAAEVAAALTEATAENARLHGEVLKLGRDLTAITEGRAALAALHENLTAALEQQGLKASAFTDDKGAIDAAKLKATLDLRVATLAREKVAAAGGKVLDESPAADATQGGAVKAKPAPGASRAAHWAYCHTLPVAEQSAYYRTHLQAGSPQIA